MCRTNKHAISKCALHKRPSVRRCARQLVFVAYTNLDEVRMVGGNHRPRPSLPIGIMHWKIMNMDISVLPGGAYSNGDTAQPDLVPVR